MKTIINVNKGQGNGKEYYNKYDSNRSLYYQQEEE
jgi:hypothetical protein